MLLVRFAGEHAAREALAKSGSAGHQDQDAPQVEFAVLEALDRQLAAGSVRCRSDRVAALRLVAVLGGEPDVEATLPATPGAPAEAPE
jgi:hypothetical protein